MSVICKYYNTLAFFFFFLLIKRITPNWYKKWKNFPTSIFPTIHRIAPTEAYLWVRYWSDDRCLHPTLHQNSLLLLCQVFVASIFIQPLINWRQEKMNSVRRSTRQRIICLITTWNLLERWMLIRHEVNPIASKVPVVWGLFMPGGSQNGSWGSLHEGV